MLVIRRKAGRIGGEVEIEVIECAGNESIARDEERIDRLRAQVEARMAAADAAIAALEQKANYISSVFTAMAQAQENSQ
jgi:glutamate formiminotransferase